MDPKCPLYLHSQGLGLTFLSPGSSAQRGQETQVTGGSVHVGFRINGILAHFMSVNRTHLGPGGTFVELGQYSQMDQGMILMHILKSHLEEGKV